MRHVSGLLSPLCMVLIVCVPAAPAWATTVTYVYRGNNFDQFDGAPGIFYPTDRVEARFTIDCAIAHTEGDCRDLPFDDYIDLGAIDLRSLHFSAGPALLPTPDGSLQISIFQFSTDSLGQVDDWDMDLHLQDPSLNVDTDNVNGGFDSAGAMGAGGKVTGRPGTWGSEFPADQGDFDLSIDKTVDDPVPRDLLQAYEFTISVENHGPGPATDVVVVDTLPPELEIPEGLAASTSVGYFDAGSGRWNIGELTTTIPEVLKIPVMIKDPQSACIANTASVELPGDTNSSNNRATSVLSLQESGPCIDLSVEAYDLSTSRCPDKKASIIYDVIVKRSATETAHNVVLELTQTGFQAPGFKSESPDCDGLICTWDVLDEDVTVRFSSDYFALDEAIEHDLTAVLSSETPDYATANNTIAVQATARPFTGDCQGGGFNFNLGGGGGCFIATAVYGSKFHPYVKILRDFRDDVLMKSTWGQGLVDVYYRLSPDVARIVAERKGLRVLVRALLTPVVFVVAYPWPAALCLMAVVFMVIIFAHRAGKKSATS